MREIKFRAWDIMQNKMYYGVAIDGSGRLLCLNNEETGYVEWYSDHQMSVHGISKDNEILMQYTGLTINGKEIYEGDIVAESFQNAGYTADVYEGAVVWWDSGWFIDSKEDGMIALTDSSDNIDIIGNIYENGAT